MLTLLVIYLLSLFTTAEIAHASESFNFDSYKTVPFIVRVKAKGKSSAAYAKVSIELPRYKIRGKKVKRLRKNKVLFEGLTDKLGTVGGEIRVPKNTKFLRVAVNKRNFTGTFRPRKLKKLSGFMAPSAIHYARIKKNRYMQCSIKLTKTR